MMAVNWRSLFIECILFTNYSINDGCKLELPVIECILSTNYNINDDHFLELPVIECILSIKTL